MLFSRARTRDAVVLVCLALSQAACSSDSAPQTAGSKPQIATTSAPQLDVAFACLWWSEAQMEGLNPNTPPPKETEVRITKWEYTDPVGVPHPDVIDVVVTLANLGKQVVPNLSVEVVGEWNEGATGSAASAAFSQPTVIKSASQVSIAAAGRQVVRVPVNLKEKMESLGKQNKWPYGFRATVTVREPGAVEALARASADLSIRPAD